MKKKTIRKIIAIGCAGTVLGATASMIVAGPASALITYPRCDAQLTQQAKDATRLYNSGAITKAAYDRAMAENAAHRIAWGC